ncbi:expressed protein [Phakopsora pachyrhizi]|uniref:Expressed protein n=1 Tax=Phakopsora pachyrhizi TaxID=170000 RepID=A0AAV0BI78_PHAPC|nr:expressed protein [Phakopsora pachyrhizi]
MNDFESAQSSTLQDSRNISDDRHTPDLFFTHLDIAHLQKGEHHYRTIGPALVLKSYRAKEDPLNLPSTPRTVNESSDSVVDTSPIIHPLGSIYSETGIIEIWLNPVESPQRSSRSFNSHPYQLDNHDEHKRKGENIELRYPFSLPLACADILYSLLQIITREKI